MVRSIPVDDDRGNLGLDVHNRLAATGNGSRAVIRSAPIAQVLISPQE